MLYILSSIALRTTGYCTDHTRQVSSFGSLLSLSFLFEAIAAARFLISTFLVLSSISFLLSSLFSLSLVTPLVVLSDAARLGGLCCCGLCARSSSNKGRTQLTGFYRKPWGDTVRSRALPLTSLRCRIAGLKRLSSRLEQTCAEGRIP